jgi:hypothetical protein
MHPSQFSITSELLNRSTTNPRQCKCASRAHPFAASQPPYAVRRRLRSIGAVTDMQSRQCNPPAALAFGNDSPAVSKTLAPATASPPQRSTSCAAAAPVNWPQHHAPDRSSPSPSRGGLGVGDETSVALASSPHPALNWVEGDPPRQGEGRQSECQLLRNCRAPVLTLPNLLPVRMGRRDNHPSFTPQASAHLRPSTVPLRGLYSQPT